MLRGVHDQDLMEGPTCQTALGGSVRWFFSLGREPPQRQVGGTIRHGKLHLKSTIPMAKASRNLGVVRREGIHINLTNAFADNAASSSRPRQAKDRNEKVKKNTPVRRPSAPTLLARPKADCKQGRDHQVRPQEWP